MPTNMQTRVVLFSISIFVSCVSGTSCGQETDAQVRELLDQVAEHVQQKEYNQASKILGEILKADKENAEAWQMLGYTLQVAGDLDRAIVIHKKAATFETSRISAYYNLACAYALKNETRLSLEYLEKAIDGGFGDENMLKQDPDLDSIRGEKKFAALLARFTAPPQSRVTYFRPTILRGQYEVISGAYVGKKLSPAQLPIPTLITDDQIRLTVDTKEIVMQYSLDLDKRPVEIDLKFLKGKEKYRDCKGIVDFNGDLVTLCYQSTGDARPTAYVSSPQEGNVLLEMRKKAATIKRADLVGKWKFDKGFRGSDAIDKERLTLGISIGEREIELPGSDGAMLVVHYQIDSTKSPPVIDMVLTEPETGRRISNGLGIIQLKNQRLTICYDPTGKVRPLKFATTKKDGFFLFTLQRAE
jgi:uncharacterized protein (TIGR03067 family)